MDKVTPLRRKAKGCPICGKPAEDRYKPFCSARCADVDLGRWLGGDYRIPVEDEPEDDGTFGPNEKE
ncbi:DNA gyrase inhibitor YacG [Telmatospirillum sp. J64-1]|uniref:DNA gyrase inhibitor YacG n=1 Tax=Telmatospirillum sp. J64-1 TaxID=2502183 RepID=UPI00115D5A4F|nr:DNA gyrase inhibitor YacG [Telmatospirillum sp. J64-1]